jgi:hypothetical protein
MNNIHNLTIVFFLLTNSVIAQTFTGNLFSSDSLRAIDQASIFNRVNEKYTISDRKGRFKIESEPTDTLEIRKLGYEQLVVRVEELQDSIVLKRQLVELPPVFLSNKKPSRLNKKLKTDVQVGLSFLKTYAFKLDVKQGQIIKYITLPIKNKSKHSSVGSLSFQIFAKSKDKMSFERPRTKVFTINDLDDLGKKLKLNLTDFEVKKGERLYLLIERNISKKDKAQLSGRTSSLNPFLKCQTGAEPGALKIRFKGQEKWYDASQMYGRKNIPSLAAGILGYQK